MNLRTFECFLILAEELNFSRAAERLHIAQPALSQQILSLEKQLGAQLIDRTRRPLHLTEAGQYFQAGARQVLSAFEQATLGAAEIGRGKRGWLSIGFTRSSMYSLLPPALKAFHHQYPNVELKLFEMLTDEQTNALRDLRIHSGIGRQPIPVDGYTTLPLLRERFVAALASDHPLARRKSLSIADLADTPLILFPAHQNAKYKHSILSLYRDAGVEPFVAHQTYEIQTAIALVAAGLGVTFVGESVAQHGRADVVFRHLAGPGSSRRSTLAATFRDDDSSPHLKAFLTCLPEPLPEAL
jgi:DNA-binding transcriptional LysR family regulator